MRSPAVGARWRWRYFSSVVSSSASHSRPESSVGKNRAYSSRQTASPRATSRRWFLPVAAAASASRGPTKASVCAQSSSGRDASICVRRHACARRSMLDGDRDVLVDFLGGVSAPFSRCARSCDDARSRRCSFQRFWIWLGGVSPSEAVSRPSSYAAATATRPPTTTRRRLLQRNLQTPSTRRLRLRPSAPSSTARLSAPPTRGHRCVRAPR
mmetsp:Transcript_26254/g.80801  ORF Transcript_26254/g.80801 Transcript_26254/m.80801 type:complete len:212 (+) Transcript_26254:257-892(+)